MDMVGRRKIDEKHHVEVRILDGQLGPITIVKTTNGQPIPDDEPTMLFRGRDKLALSTLLYYRDLCLQDGATFHHIELMDKLIKAFTDFLYDHPDRMKQPGSTMGS